MDNQNSQNMQNAQNIPPNIPPASDPRDFSAPVVPLIPAEEPKKKKSFLALWIVIIVIVLGAGGFFGYKFLSKKPSEPKDPTSIASIAETATDVYFGAEDAIAENKGEAEIIAAMDEVIAKAPEEQKRSLNIFEFFMMARYEFTGSALLKYYDLMSMDNLNQYEECAIFDIRALLDKFEGKDESAASYRAKAELVCTKARDERLERKEDEPEFEYAERLYLNGYISFAKEEFEKMDLEKLGDDFKMFAYSVLSDYYRLNRETDKFQEFLNKYLEIAQPKGESEE